MWGCDKPTSLETDGFVYPLGGVIIRRCPNALLKRPWTQEACKLFLFYRKGILPKPGGLNEQSAMYVNAMALLESLQNEASAWYHRQKETPE